MNKGWRKEPYRHGLASRGIKTRKQTSQSAASRNQAMAIRHQLSVSLDKLNLTPEEKKEFMRRVKVSYSPHFGDVDVMVMIGLLNKTAESAFQKTLGMDLDKSECQEYQLEKHTYLYLSEDSKFPGFNCWLAKELRPIFPKIRYDADYYGGYRGVGARCQIFILKTDDKLPN